MEDARFDAWTRRRLGLAAGGSPPRSWVSPESRKRRARSERSDARSWAQAARLAASAGAAARSSATASASNPASKPAAAASWTNRVPTATIVVPTSAANSLDCAAQLASSVTATARPTSAQSTPPTCCNASGACPSLPGTTPPMTRRCATSGRWRRTSPPSSASAPTTATSTRSMARVWRWRPFKGSPRRWRVSIRQTWHSRGGWRVSKAEIRDDDTIRCHGGGPGPGADAAGVDRRAGNRDDRDHPGQRRFDTRWSG